LFSFISLASVHSDDPSFGRMPNARMPNAKFRMTEFPNTPISKCPNA
jgi:hypothetical protein